MLRNITKFLSLDRKLFLAVISIFLIFVSFFILYQLQREKVYKVNLLDNSLQEYNDYIASELAKGKDYKRSLKDISAYLGKKKVRITIFTTEGEVLYDSNEGNIKGMENHNSRKEVAEAKEHGTGYDSGRKSYTEGIEYFYSATSYDNYIVRTAVPYDTEIRRILKVDSRYIWPSVVISLVLVFFFYRFTKSLGRSVKNLKEFTVSVERNEPFHAIRDAVSTDNELGEISQHIIQIYQRLHKTKEELYIEKEKLITHLQTSREGLGVFTKDKKEILVNNLFIKYANIISDYNMKTTEEVFGIQELQPVNEFINRTHKKQLGREEKRMSLTINKSGRSFMVECIIFQDMSFEISINDVTQEEEQTLLKRQLTQNIAHELKTPVSSIQAYLETIVSNPDIDPQKRQLFLDRCYEQSNRLSRLLRDISVLTRMDEAAPMLEMENVNIAALVEKIMNEVAIDLEKKNMKVIYYLKKNIVIRGNYSLIYSVFRNLMDNAIAYAGTDVQILINCFRQDENFYYFSFADTGVGVKSEHLQRLFERFYRIDKGRSRKVGGTGLGLAIVKNAVLIHGGNISVKHYQGGGLEFIFTLAKDK